MRRLSSPESALDAPERLVHEVVLDLQQELAPVHRGAPGQARDRLAEHALTGVLVEVAVVEEHVGDPRQEPGRPVDRLPGADAADARVCERLAHLGRDVRRPDRVRVDQGDQFGAGGPPAAAQRVALAGDVGDDDGDGVAARDVLAGRVGGVDDEDDLFDVVGQPRLDRRGEDLRVLLVDRHDDAQWQPVVIDHRLVEHRGDAPHEPGGPADQPEHAERRAEHVVVEREVHADSRSCPAPTTVAGARSSLASACAAVSTSWSAIS